ncbi:hypothetical protein DM860_007110 [Cuscuta australis]|uniref:Uncharacterized protein n=1 Tax=Cuscuta australis TaxID=267555 RepID=A0A328E9U3_9ASTE|nr:hypothetical protein DM860_007110 [Cuscuta australis]
MEGRACLVSPGGHIEDTQNKSIREITTNPITMAAFTYLKINEYPFFIYNDETYMKNINQVILKHEDNGGSRQLLNVAKIKDVDHGLMNSETIARKNMIIDTMVVSLWRCICYELYKIQNDFKAQSVKECIGLSEEKMKENAVASLRCLSETIGRKYYFWEEPYVT